MKHPILVKILPILLAAALLAGCASPSGAAVADKPGVGNLPTPTASPVPQVTEQFKAEQPNTWSDPVFIVGNKKMSDISTDSGSLMFTLRDVETYAYRFYDKSVYDDVVVSATVTNMGDNTNGISLVCRASDQGWYEFRIASGGTYEVFLYDQKLKDKGQNPYKLLDSGGSGLISAKTNNVQFVCKGSSLKIFSGDQEIKPHMGPIEDSTFTKGKIGVGVQSFSRVPVVVDFEKVSIAKAN